MRRASLATLQVYASGGATIEVYVYDSTIAQGEPNLQLSIRDFSYELMAGGAAGHGPLTCDAPRGLPDSPGRAKMPSQHHGGGLPPPGDNDAHHSHPSEMARHDDRP